MRILLVDDSAVYRRFVREALSDMPMAEIVGDAANGAVALDLIDKLDPHIVILDIHMPILDGIGVLEALRRRGHGPAVIVLTSDATVAIEQTTRALALGAFDFVLKPRGSESEVTLACELKRRIEAIGRSQLGRRTPDSTQPNADNALHQRGADSRPPAEVIAVGVSTGGPVALATVLPKIAKDFTLPILVVQHMPQAFTQALADHLNELCAIPVFHSSDGDLIEPGCVYLAPGGRQMEVEDVDGQRRLRITDSPAVNNCRPSMDYLLDSVASVYGGASLALIMTGMGRDGTEGCRKIREQQGTVVTQDAASCVVYGMPRSVVDAGLSVEAWPLDQIARRLSGMAKLEGRHVDANAL